MHQNKTLWVYKFHDIILKGDALQIVKTIKTTWNNRSSFEHTVNGIKLELRKLRSWIIEHVKQDANIATHTITKKVILGVIDRIWIEKNFKSNLWYISRDLVHICDWSYFNRYYYYYYYFKKNLVSITVVWNLIK
jgi:hypothetical protein